MQLAADPIFVEIAGEAYELRPTLRAATRLARRHGDFATLYQNIITDHIGSVADVVREGSGSLQAAADFSTACELPGLRDLLAGLKLPLLRYVLALAGHDPAAPQRNHRRQAWSHRYDRRRAQGGIRLAGRSSALAARPGRSA
jgi:hypothetical protein